jgi:hypothetical protein
MSPSCPRVLALALASTILLAACINEDEAEMTGSDGSAITASSAAASDGSGESEASVSSSASSSDGAGGEVICAEAIATELGKETEDLLYPSESDYPFEALALEDPQGDGAITPARLLALLALDPQTRTETRTVDALFANLLVGPEGARAQVALDTLQGRLTDLAVIRIIPAAPSSARIHVYVVGRTPCGEVAGLTTVSIET